MAYNIVLAPQAIEDLDGLKANVRSAVRAGMQKHLRHEPRRLSRSRIKQLRKLAQPQFRLKLGDVRVFYDVTETTVQVLAIVAKSEAETWLSTHGRAE